MVIFDEAHNVVSVRKAPFALPPPCGDGADLLSQPPWPRPSGQAGPRHAVPPCLCALVRALEEGPWAGLLLL